MITWHSLYLSSDQQQTITEALQATVQQLGYTLYNPFGLMPGIAYPQTLKLFVAPAEHGWSRILVEATNADDADQLARNLSNMGVCLIAQLVSTEGGISAYVNGEPVVDLAALLSPYLKSDITADQLQAMLKGENLIEAGESAQPQVMAVSLDDLPPDVQAMASNLKTNDIQKMFGKLTGQLMGSSQKDAASQMLNTLPDWTSEAGRQIQSVMMAVTMPANWREPDFPTLRAAYLLHARLERNPDTMMYPGDQEALDEVPDVGDYTPVYGGKDA